MATLEVSHLKSEINLVVPAVNMQNIRLPAINIIFLNICSQKYQGIHLNLPSET